ncbi:MAG: glycosyltransferase [Desulfovibrio sp.]|nr:glycosyltransferase [Desulfovibrio sp.]
MDGSGRRPLKVLFLMEDLRFGGTQRQTIALARRLDRERFLPVVATLTGPTDMDGEVRDAGIELRHLGRGRDVAWDFLPGVFRMLREMRPDVLVPCTAIPNIWGRIFGRLLRVPAIVGTCRGGGAPVRQHERFLWRLAHRVVCNSGALERTLLDMGVPSGRVACIVNGVDAHRFAPGEDPVSGRPPLILCVGRLHEDKDPLTLLRAFERVLEARGDARLRIVGDGPEGEVVRAWVEGHEAGAAVELVPGTRDVLGHYGRARLLVLASRREGTPNVILEAMACGLPVCATNVGGIPSLVEDGVTGCLSDAGDVGALAGNLLALLDDPSGCERMGLAGRERVLREYSFEVMVRRHEEIFAALAGR